MEKKEIHFNYNLNLDIYTYKIFKCKDISCKLNQKCFYYHNKFDKRRRIDKNSYYYPKKCDCTFNKIYNHENCICINNCKCLDNDCEYSHNIYEILYHPLKYKTQICNNILKCIYGKFCCNAHNETELNIELIHHFPIDSSFFIFKFKTEFCPIIKNHIKKTCAYAHNFQEFRRKPRINCNNTDCEKWNKDKKIPNIYKEKCSTNCNKFHGWKEYDYHPKNYKVRKCKEKFKNCKYNFICPRIHKDKNDKIETEKNFNIIPKNNTVFNSKKN